MQDNREIKIYIPPRIAFNNYMLLRKKSQKEFAQTNKTIITSWYILIGPSADRDLISLGGPRKRVVNPNIIWGEGNPAGDTTGYILWLSNVGYSRTGGHDARSRKEDSY